jgi:hypothetical protein
MNCDEVRPLLDVLYDGALNAKDTAIVLEHLKGCAVCDFEWSDMVVLKTRFKAAKQSTEAPSELFAKILQALKKEDADDRRQQFLRFFSTPRRLAVVAVSLVVLCLFALSPTVLQLANKPAAGINAVALDNLLYFADHVALSPAVKPEENLSAALGFEPKFIKMNGWNKQRAFIYADRVPGVKLAQFEFDSTESGERLYCFQGLEGTIASDTNAVPTDVAGKSVKFGSYRNFQYALWSQSGRDYLVVAPMSREALTELVHDA